MADGLILGITQKHVLKMQILDFILRDLKPIVPGWSRNQYFETLTSESQWF